MGFNDSSAFADRATEDALVAEVCGEYGARTRECLKSYLPQDEAGNHLPQLLADYPGRGGKMLRPSLCIATARAFGASIEDALPCAVSIELLHNAMLIHDDIEDESEERRGTPTLHALHGMPIAVNVGDALGLLSMRPLKENVRRLGAALSYRIFEETERMAWESTEGQALELAWRHEKRSDIGDEDYLTMVLKKTCWLTTIHPLRVGCLIGARGKVPIEPLIRLGFFFGAAFQIQDDLLNLEPGANYGKEVAGDLLEGKRTLMLVHAMRSATDLERRRMKEFLELERAQRSAMDVRWILDLMASTGAMEHARMVARGLAGAALYEFTQFFGDQADSRDLRFIRALVTWVLRRLH